MNNLHESQRRNSSSVKGYNGVIHALRKREKHFQRLERLIIGLYVVIVITTAWLSIL
jgi:hypothetical protein